MGLVTLYPRKWSNILQITFQFGIILSCIVLVDAFRRLNQVKSETQIIQKKIVILLIFAFGLFGFSLILEDLIYTIKNIVYTITVQVLVYISYFLSVVTTT